jgi:hypothetical protein
MNSFTTALAASLLASAAASAFAADFPKSGSTKATGYLTAAITDQLDGWDADWQPENYVLTGIIRNETDGGPFDKSFLRCIGVEAMVAGKYWDNGTCTETDTDGDKIFITYGVGTFTFVGGTGKYKGITGGGTNSGSPIFQDKKNAAYVVVFEKTWEMK